MAGRRIDREASRDLALAFLGVRSIDDIRMKRVIAQHIERVLTAADGNLSLAAELLGINRRSLQRLKQRKRRSRS